MLQHETKTILSSKVIERAIIYARVSTDEQAETGTSLNNQVERSLAYADALGLKVVNIFREDYSGKTLERPELVKVRELLQNGQAEHVIAYKPNRLDRSEWGLNLLILMAELKQMSVSLHYSEAGRQIDLSNPMEAFMYGSFAGWQAGEDHRETVTKLYEGRVNKAKAGNVMGSHLTPYGYQVYRWQEGKQKRRTLVIDEAEAPAVRLIFQWYVIGDETGARLSIRAIAAKLDQMGVPTRYGAKWGNTTLAHILKNKTYIGQWEYCKRSKLGTAPEPVAVEPIIDTETFEAAQEQLRENVASAKRNRKDGRYLLAHRVTCGDCGYKMSGVSSQRGKYSYVYYGCPSRFGNGHSRKCDARRFRADKVDATAWQYLADIAHDPDKLEKGLRGYQAATQEKIGPVQNELNHVNVLIVQHVQDLEEANENMEAVTGKRSKARYALQIDQIERTLDALEARKAGLEGQLNQKSITDEEIVQIRQFFAMIADDWEEISKDFASRQALVAWLDIQIRLVIEDGQQIVYLRGRIVADEKRLPVVSTIPQNGVHNQQTGFIIEARLVID